ncbi:ABC transporter type 1, transmembrane domain-containing protein [Mycena galericulata]|nr:ABC transporter type 1, transmembrane domain-containing protein [Mycena galericulata]
MTVLGTLDKSFKFYQILKCGPGSRKISPSTVKDHLARDKEQKLKKDQTRDGASISVGAFMSSRRKTRPTRTLDPDPPQTPLPTEDVEMCEPSSTNSESLVLPPSPAPDVEMPDAFVPFGAANPSRASGDLHGILRQSSLSELASGCDPQHTIPMGRIINIFGKDIDTVDNLLPMSMRMFILVLASVVGSVVVITIVEHYFREIPLLLGILPSSAIEMKRLDAMLRGILYAHLFESLTGLPTIRSYGEMLRFIQDNKFYIDLENRASFLTVTNQRWLAVRLDALESILVFLVAIFAACGSDAHVLGKYKWKTTESKG